VGAPDAANDPLLVGGAFSAMATHTGLAMTAGGANSAGGSAASLGATLALAFVTDKTTSTTGRSLTAQGGGATFEADGSAASLVTASASASGGGPTPEEEAQEPNNGPAPGGEAAAGSDTADPNSVDGQNAEERSFADSESGTLTDSKGNAANAGDTSKDAKTPAAKTSDGSVTVAAAVAVNIVNSEASATIPSGLTITTAGPLTVTATNDTGYIDNNNSSFSNPVFNPISGSPGDSANAWGTAAGTSSVGVGAAVALNLINNSTVATIGASTINAQGVTVNAGMMNPDSANTPLNQFVATAASGAAGGEVGVAGSVAINIVANTSKALIETGASVNANSGDVNVTSLNNAYEQATSYPTSTGSNGQGAKVGIGAALGLNILSNSTQSEIEDGVGLTNAGNVTVTASSSQSLNAWAQNGAESEGGVGISAGIAITLASDQTTARIGSDPQTLMASGAVSIGASATFANVALADATTAAGANVGVGASVTVNLTKNSVLAELDRNVTAGGAVSVTAAATASSQATATASVEGGNGQGTDTSTGSNGTADTETQNQSGFAHDEASDPSVQAADEVPAPPKANDELSSPSGEAKGKSGGEGGSTSVGIAGAVAINILTTSTVAQIDNGLTVTAGGALTVGTTNQSSALALADARGVGIGAGTTDLGNGKFVSTPPTELPSLDKYSIGAAVSLNVATVTNTATIGANDVINAAGVSVTALMPPAGGSTPSVNDFSTQGLGAAVGSQVGVAGSAGINVITVTTQASIGANTVVTSSAGLTVQAANDETFQDVSFVVAVGKNVGAGAAINVNVLNNPTSAFLDSGVQANVADATSVTSESSVNPSQDPIPNTPAETIVSAGNLTTGSPVVTAVGGAIDNNLGRGANAPFIGEPVSGPGIPDGTVIAVYYTQTFNANLTLGSNVITSNDPIFLALSLPQLQQLLIGATINGPGIPYNGTTITAVSLSLATGLTLTLSSPVIGTGATGSAAMSFNYMVLSQPANADETGTNIYNAATNAVATAMSTLHPTNFVAGVGASSGGAGIAGSVIVNVINQTTHAYIGSGDQINTLIGTAGYPTANADEGVTVSATETVNLVDWAGALGGGDNVGFGAALDVSIVTEDDQAYISHNATVDAAQNVAVTASTNGTFNSITAALGLSGSTAIAGAASIDVLSPTTEAYIDHDTTVDAQGDLEVQASRQATIDTLAGQLGVSGDASVGAAVSTIVDTVNTDAYLGANDQVTAKGTSGTLPVLVGDTPGDTTPFSGVAVVAATFQNVQSIVVGGAVASSVGAAGSVAVNVLNDTTLAYISAGANVNATNSLPGTGPGVIVTAADPLTLFSTAGALAVGGDAGLGIGADVDSITKNTQAYIATAAVTADGNILVQAKSSEGLTSITAAVGASGSVAVVGSASVYVLNITTRAFVGDDPNNPTAGSTNVQADGSVLIAASEATVLDLLSGNFSGSGEASVGAAATVPVIKKTTEAFVGAGANVGALGLGNGVNAENGQFAITYQPYGTSPGMVQPKPMSANLTGNGNNLTSPRLGQERVATPQTQLVNGLAVTAVNADSLQGVGVTGGASGAVAVNLSGSVAVLTNQTDAYIGSGAAINANNAGAASGQSVLVGAGNDTSFLGIAGALSISGTVAVAPGVVVLVINNTTTATIADGASVAALGDVAVAAHSSGDVLTIAAAAAVSGTGSGGGAISYVGVNDTTQANIGNAPATAKGGAQVNAGGNVLVDATDDTEAYQITGALAVGVDGAGIGGAVSIVNLSKNTFAFIGNYATVNALGNSASLAGIFDGNDTAGGGFETLASFHGVAVQAATSENVTNIAAAGAAGFYAGLAGGVSIELFNSTTKAYTGNNAQINTNSVGASAAQSVDVAAVNQASNFSFAGGLGGGIAGIAGGVDVGLLKNSTQAYIGNNSTVDAQQDVDVYALSNDNVQTYGLGAAVGIVGLAGSVSVWSIGVPYSAGYTDGNSSDGTLQGVPTSGITNSSSSGESQTGGASSMVGSLTSSSNNGAAGNTQYISGTVNSNQGGVNGAISGDPVASAIASTAVPTGTVAFVGSGVSVNAKAGNVNVRAKSEVSYTGLGGGLAAGAVGIGASVVIANIEGNTQAYIDANSTVTAGGNVAVDAELVNDTSNATAFAGTVGIVGLGGQVAVIEDSSTESATINSGVTIPQAQQVQVTASSNRSLKALATGGDIGGIAAGIGVAIANATGGATASMDTGATQVGSVSVKSTDTDSATATGDALAAGIGALSVNYAQANVTPTVAASIGGNVTAAGSISVMATAMPQASADCGGITGGGITIGLSLAQATVAPKVQAYLSPGANVSATQGSVDIQAQVSGLSDSAQANASGGGVLGAFNGSEADAVAAPMIDAYVGAGATAAAGANGQNVNITASSTGSTTSQANGLSAAGFVAGGADLANAAVGQASLTEILNPSGVTTPSAETKAYADTGATLTAGGNISIAASSSQNASATASASAGAVVSGAAASANVTRNDPVTASANDNATLTAGNDISITANNGTTQLKSSSSNIVGGAGVAGSPNSSTTVADGTTAQLGGNVRATATLGNFTLQAITNDTGLSSDAEANGVSGISVVSSNATTTTNDPATAQVGTRGGHRRTSQRDSTFSSSPPRTNRIRPMPALAGSASSTGRPTPQRPPPAPTRPRRTFSAAPA
jgi:hypothetical protein